MSKNKKRNQASGLVISSITGGQKPELNKATKLQDLNEVKKKLPEVEPLKPNSRQSSHFISLSPASIQVSKTEPQRKKSENYQSRKPITAWSAKSRSNMVARFLTLDYSPLFEDDTRTPALITLTYPSEWQIVVPDGQTFKRHVQALQKRFEVAFGEKLRGLWKMEFQRRGAPHLHVLTSLNADIETVREWFSNNWADIVNHPDKSEKQKHEAAGTRIDAWHDFKTFQAYLIAVYFSKHSSPSGLSVKNYQNRVPELWVEAGNVGRFWGYWGLTPAVAKAQVSEQDALFIKRLLRRWHKATSQPIRVRVPRIDMKTGVVTYRWVRRKQKRMTGKGGFMSVPDGVSMGELLALALESRGQDSPAVEQSSEVSNLSFFRLDSGLSGSQSSVLFDNQTLQSVEFITKLRPFSFQIPVFLGKLLDSCHGATKGSSTLTLDWFSRQRCVWRQPAHVNKSRTRNTPHTLRQISTTGVKLTLIRLIPKLRRRKTSQTHGFSHRVHMFFRDVLGQVFKAICHVFAHNKNNNTKS